MGLRFDRAGNGQLQTDRKLTERSQAKDTQTGEHALTCLQTHAYVKGMNATLSEGQHLIEALGRLRLLTANLLELGALESIELTTARDLNENVAGKRQSSIKEALTMLVEEKGQLSIDEEGAKLTSQGKLHLGTEEVNLTEVVHSLIELVASAMMSLAKHTHSAPEGTTGPPINSGSISGNASKADALATQIKPLI